METKTFDVPTLVSVTSGVLLTMPFSKVTEAIEWILGHPVWTHELGSDALWQLTRAKLLEQHPDLDVDASKVDSENCQAFVDELTARLGQSREVVKGDEHRGADPVTTARNFFGPDAEIVPVLTGDGDRDG